MKRVERFRSGILDLGFGPVDISAGIDWSADPFDTTMWGFRLHNLQWLYDFFRVATEDRDEAAAPQANSVIQSWVDHNAEPGEAAPMAWDNHVTALRARVMVCSVMAFDGSFRDVLEAHAEVLAPVAVAEPAWNHGTDQLLTLLAIACALGDDALEARALGRLDVTLPYIIDERGVSNEQAPTYDYYVWSQLEELARLVESCGLDPIPSLERRHRTPNFLAHATRPDGTWANLGDTTPKRVNSIPGTPLEYALSAGQRGSPPTDSVAIYDRGYVFGRSGWGGEREFGDESWYSIRFGPARRLHGHRDHTSYTWYALGRPLVVDSGFGGYDDDEFRRYDRSEFAHNQVVVSGAGDFDEAAGTPLLDSDRGEQWETYRLQDRPYETVRRSRTLFVSHRPPVMVIRDDLSNSGGSCEFTSLVHLPSDVSELRLEEGRCEVHFPGGRSLSVVFDGAERIETFEGPEGSGGWVADGIRSREPAKVIAASVTGHNATITAVLVPSEHDDVAVVVGLSGETTVTVGLERVEVVYDRGRGLLVPPDRRISVFEAWARVGYASIRRFVARARGRVRRILSNARR